MYTYIHIIRKLDMAIHNFNSKIPELQASRLLRGQGQPNLYNYVGHPRLHSSTLSPKQKVY